MEFTALFVVLLLGVGIPLRNKAIKEYRKKRDKDSDHRSPRRKHYRRQRVRQGKCFQYHFSKFR